MALYQIDPARSKLKVSGRSSLHPMHGSARSACLLGTIEATVSGGAIDCSAPTSGTVQFPVEQLSFGNSLYDRELPKRLETRQHPLIVIELKGTKDAGDRKLLLDLDLRFHGIGQHFSEEVSIGVEGDDTIVVSGRHSFDVRDFGVQPPKMLGMSVKPDFEVEVEVVATKRPSEEQ